MSVSRHIQGSRTTALGVLCICAALFTTRSGYGEGKVLIVSSDKSVSKYAVAHAAFAEAIASPTSEVDLATERVDRAKPAQVKAQLSKAKAELAKAIESEDPSLVYCLGSNAYVMTYELARERRIVFSLAINWQRFPLGDRTCGVANELPAGMQLTMLRYFFPKIQTIGVLYSKQFNREWLKHAKAAAKEMDVDVKGYSVKKPKDIQRAVEKAMRKVDALWLIPDPVVLSDEESVKRIFGLSKAQKKPILAYSTAFARQGAVMAISADIPTIGRQAAALAQDALADVAIDEKVQTPAGTEITINLKTVQEYGLELNEDALDSVNNIIR